MTTEPPAAPSTQKKGMSPWAWVGIGCAVIILVGLLGVGGCTWWVARQVKQVADDPMKAAEWVIKMNPDLEVVESAGDDGTMTLRQKSTGKVASFNLDDIKEGRFTFDTGEGEQTVSFTGDDEEGAITVTDDSGQTTMRFGGGQTEEIPDWVPIYPDTDPDVAYHMSQGDTVNGAFTLETKRSQTEVVEFYEDAMKKLGMKVSKTSFSGSDAEESSILGGKSDDGRQLSMTVSTKKGVTTAVISYVIEG